MRLTSSQSSNDLGPNRNLFSSSSQKNRHSIPVRLKVVSDNDNPLSQKMLNTYENVPPKVKKENLTIRKEDEGRVVQSLQDAAKKKSTGSIYSVVVDLGRAGTLGIGVKDLSDNILAVSMLKRENDCPGAGEEAGIRLGDIIFGINFIPTREGSKTLINVIKRETEKRKMLVHIQGWRCHQLCSDSIPGYRFPRADDVIVQAYALFRSKVFSDWERWNFIEILLGHMIEDLRMRTEQENELDEASNHIISSHGLVRAKQMQVLDLERNILQAKGLRTALCVRIVHTKSQGDTVVYVLRVEDVESGLQWVVQRRYSDFYALNEELQDLSHFAKEVDFPRKRISIRNTAKLVEIRIVALEQYTRKMVHILTLYATMDTSASKSLRHLQNFLGVDKYVDCIHPPPLDDQRFIELMAYRFLNDFCSPACQQCVRFITTVDLDNVTAADTDNCSGCNGSSSSSTEGYAAVLSYMHAALAEVELFVQQQHQQQMVQALRSRRPDYNAEQLRSFVRKCIRRQVEAALYLPLRRTVFRIVFSFLSQKSKSLQRSITLLQRASPNFLMVDPYVPRARSLPSTVKAFRRVIQAYLPADQGQLLILAANAVTALHKECQEEKARLRALAAAATTATITTDVIMNDTIAGTSNSSTAATSTADNNNNSNNSSSMNSKINSTDYLFQRSSITSTDLNISNNDIVNHYHHHNNNNSIATSVSDRSLSSSPIPLSLRNSETTTNRNSSCSHTSSSNRSSSSSSYNDSFDMQMFQFDDAPIPKSSSSSSKDRSLSRDLGAEMLQGGQLAAENISQDLAEQRFMRDARSLSTVSVDRGMIAGVINRRHSCSSLISGNNGSNNNSNNNNNNNNILGSSPKRNEILQDLFVRKKSSGDLFNNSDSEDEDRDRSPLRTRSAHAKLAIYSAISDGNNFSNDSSNTNNISSNPPSLLRCKSTSIIGSNRSRTVSNSSTGSRDSYSNNNNSNNISSNSSSSMKKDDIQSRRPALYNNNDSNDNNTTSSSDTGCLTKGNSCAHSDDITNNSSTLLYEKSQLEEKNDSSVPCNNHHHHNNNSTSSKYDALLDGDNCNISHRHQRYSFENNNNTNLDSQTNDIDYINNDSNNNNVNNVMLSPLVAPSAANVDKKTLNKALHINWHHSIIDSHQTNNNEVIQETKDVNNYEVIQEIKDVNNNSNSYLMEFKAKQKVGWKDIDTVDEASSRLQQQLFIDNTASDEQHLHDNNKILNTVNKSLNDSNDEDDENNNNNNEAEHEPSVIGIEDNHGINEEQQQHIHEQKQQHNGNNDYDITDDSVVINNSEEERSSDAISADDFLPLFTYVLVQAGLPQLLLVKELMTALVNDEDSYGECGYYLATLEAATQHICDLAEQFEKVSHTHNLDANGEELFDTL